MINAHINEKKRAPWWIAIGAPLVGVPLMVALLTLASPEKNAPVAEPEVGVRTERVEPHVVHPTELESDYIEQRRQS